MNPALVFTGPARAISILPCTESLMPSCIFLKEMPPRTISKWQNMNRNRSKHLVKSADEDFVCLTQPRVCAARFGLQSMTFEELPWQ